MNQVVVSLIVAVGLDRAIGADNKLLWHIKDDLKLFMQTTAYHVVIHGRKSFESIGTPLKNRTNIIITNDRNYTYPGCFVCHSLDEAIALGRRLEQKGELFILGGAQIYNQAMQYVDRMYISHVKGEFPHADAFFPEFNSSNWTTIHNESFEKNEVNEYAFEFCIYERKV